MQRPPRHTPGRLRHLRPLKAARLRDGLSSSRTVDATARSAISSRTPPAKDSDCFGSYCDMTGKPSPYCHVPGSTQVSQLHGITCKADSECEAVLPAGAADRGIAGKCQGRTNLDPAVCQYTCKYP
jgi:hypothetical protein